MIEYLEGQVIHVTTNTVIISCHGVGYGVEMPVTSICELSGVGQSIKVWVDTYVREDAMRLFGFLTYQDKQTFVVLRSVSGIGPKIALAILSCFDAEQLRDAILSGRVELLESVPGIGRRTAEKMILELKPKIEKMSQAIPVGQRRPVVSRSAESDVSILDQLESGKGSANLATQIGHYYLDLRSALENLGFKEKEIQSTLNHMKKSPVSDSRTEDLSFQGLLKVALKELRTGA